ncbi:hypothetical protein [Cupriavidus basilensis]|uniref:hypothetical protein n=1 Tax=Cupriavidus basilensis TaxID=68895 RepID=UPI0023E7D862|nr:hypothetical protein [Cupriavidus basilensis]MDF3886688.1 hypothetical protein [Cupriavidus basilensis]
MRFSLNRGIPALLFGLVVAFVALFALCVPRIASAQSDRDVYMVVRPGVTTVVASAGCIRMKSEADVAVVSALGESHILYTPSVEQRGDRRFTADVGAKETADKSACENAINRQYTLAVGATPEVSPTALRTSFTVLVAAAVLALLLESAFALLFNWRLFNVLLVGRMVRSPIMFAGSLLIVRQFDFDLMARLFDAYYPQSVPSTSSWGTSILTAMILAGGSVGVNRILTSLGFRSPVQSPNAPRDLDEGSAWLAVEVERRSGVDKLIVAVTEVTYDGVSPVRTAVGIAGTPRPSFRSLFNGDQWRVPRSGGIRVAAAKYYTITAQDIVSGTVYDVTGKVLPDGGRPTIFRFGPRAILDFRIRVA